MNSTNTNATIVFVSVSLANMNVMVLISDCQLLTIASVCVCVCLLSLVDCSSLIGILACINLTHCAHSFGLSLSLLSFIQSQLYSDSFLLVFIFTRHEFYLNSFLFGPVQFCLNLFGSMLFGSFLFGSVGLGAARLSVELEFELPKPSSEPMSKPIARLAPSQRERQTDREREACMPEQQRQRSDGRSGISNGYNKT